MISSRVFASALRAQAPALQAVKARPAARIFQQSRGFKNTTKLREPIPVRPTRSSTYLANSMLTLNCRKRSTLVRYPKPITTPLPCTL
jgi:hypothetical protein